MEPFPKKNTFKTFKRSLLAFQISKIKRESRLNRDQKITESPSRYVSEDFSKTFSFPRNITTIMVCVTELR